MRKKKSPNAITKKPVKKKPAKKPKAVKVARTHNGGTMTSAQYFQKLRSILRSGYRWWKPMMQALKDASRVSQSSNKRIKTEYQCAVCQGWFKRIDVQIDHVIPCGELKCFEDIVPFIQRLTAEDSSAFQVLCKMDHAVKTLEESNQRKLNKLII